MQITLSNESGRIHVAHKYIFAVAQRQRGVPIHTSRPELRLAAACSAPTCSMALETMRVHYRDGSLERWR